MKSLGGSTFAWNAIKQDYCIIESLECLYELCDQISVSFGGDDGTIDLVMDWMQDKISINPRKIIHFYIIAQEDWDAQQGREKLSYFSNIAIEKLQTDYVYYQQADEVTHESSFAYIRSAIELDEEAFMVSRINLWGCPFTALNVPQDRKPVSTEIVRLVKNKYRCVDDAESVGAPSCNLIFVSDIRMYHFGFVRNKYKHIEKIKHIQRDIFLMEYDKRADECKDGFDPWLFGFTPADVAPISEILPKFILKWASEREYDPFVYERNGCNMAIKFFNALRQGLDENDSSLHTKSFVAFANVAWWKIVKQHQRKKHAR